MAAEQLITKLGRSLHVPSVRELAEAAAATVPGRYVRPKQDLPIISDPDSDLAQVPVIDMERLLTQEFMELELHKLDHACKEWGFFQIVNHGMSIELIKELKVEIQEFFNLPMEEKKKYWQKEGDLQGFGQVFVQSEDQKIDWSDMFYIVTLPPKLRDLDLFPSLPLPLRDALETYSQEMRNICMKLMNFMAKALGMEGSDMLDVFEEGMQAMRTNCYPPCPQPELVMGFNTHSDASGITILLEVTESDEFEEGLQIKKDEMWVPIKPLPNAFIVNVGDFLEMVTNGVYHSVEHRATVSSIRERISIATFCCPKVDGEVGPAPSLITSDTHPLFKTMSVADYYKRFFSRELVGKACLDSVRIQNE